MKLTPREHGLVDRVIQKIKEFDPQAIVQIADDTLEHEDILLYVYTGKAPCLSYIGPPLLARSWFYEDLDILVIPRDRDRARTAYG